MIIGVTDNYKTWVVMQHQPFGSQDSWKTNKHQSYSKLPRMAEPMVD
jgi:hypothetical protein